MRLIIFIALSSVSKRSLSLSSLNSNMTNDLLFLFEAHQKVCSIISRNVVSFLKSASTVMVPGATLTHLSVVIHNDICHMCTSLCLFSWKFLRITMVSFWFQRSVKENMKIWIIELNIFLSILWKYKHSLWSRIDFLNYHFFKKIYLVWLISKKAI